IVEKRPVPLDRIDAPAKLRENGCLIAGPSTDLQHLHPFTDAELIGHVGDDIGLADCLPALDRQRMILVGLLSKATRYELFARHAFDRREHAIIANALAP